MTHVPDRRLPVAGARADPAPALLLQPAVAALRARRATPPFVEPAVIADDPDLHEAFLAATDAALAAYTDLLDGLEKRFADVPERHAAAQAGPAGGPRGAAQRRPRRASSSPATTAPGGTSSRCGPASTPTSRSASSPRLPARAAAGGRQRVRRLPDQRAGRRHRGRREPATSPRAEPLGGAVRPWTSVGPYPRDRGRRTDRHPVRGPPPAHPRAGHAEAGPHRHRHGQPVRRAAPLRPVRDASRW